MTSRATAPVVPGMLAPAARRAQWRRRWSLVVGVLALLAAALGAGTARADRKEVYTLLGFGAGVNRYNVPASGSGSTTAFAGALDVTVYYGLTNTLHLGGRLRVTSTSNVHFDDANVRMADGSQSVGSVFADHRSLSLGAVSLYRFDTGWALAPVLELEAGVDAHRYGRVEHVPAGAGFKYELGSKSQTALYGAGALLFEYRFANRWIAMTGISVRAETGDLQPWSLSVPLRVGVVW